MATIERSLATLITLLTDSLSSATDVVPENIVPPSDGISLLDVKNELLLSYLQNLAFLILLKLRDTVNPLAKGTSSDKSAVKNEILEREVVKKLVELRVYLERGVRPLEGRLKYQIDKVLRAADDATHREAQASNSASTLNKVTNGTPKRKDSQNSDEDEGSTSESGEDSDQEQPSEKYTGNGIPLDELAYRPNPASFLQPTTTTAHPDSTAAKYSEPLSNTRYVPPKTTPTPYNIPSSKPSKPTPRSRALDNYLDTLPTSAPTAEPSIGSQAPNSSRAASLGRRQISRREKDAAEERKRYEEENLVRLPKESKKDRLKRRRVDEREEQGALEFGGEEFGELGREGGRLARAVGRRKGEGEVGGLLGRSRRTEMGGGGDAGTVRLGDMYRRKAKKRRR
ncbi:MAG: hypothetical protein M1820_010694 [Bogoriella megaspora]|nr:MAG: hypothetical protein M1820_010694 [Bogoriella megaspora]